MLATFQVLIDTNGLFATTLDSTAVECICYEQRHFPIERFDQQDQEINTAT